MRADVVIMYYSQIDEDQDDKVDYGVIPNMPVCFINGGKYFIRPIYEKDDLVLVAWSKPNITKQLDNEDVNINDLVYNFSNASVICGIAENDYTNPTKFSSDGLLLGKADDSFIRIYNDTIELNGDQDFAVAYNDMKSAFDQLKGDLNNLITAYNAHTHTSAAPGAPTGPPLAPGVSSSADMSGAKVSKVKLP